MDPATDLALATLLKRVLVWARDGVLGPSEDRKEFKELLEIVTLAIQYTFSEFAGTSSQDEATSRGAAALVRYFGDHPPPAAILIPSLLDTDNEVNGWKVELSAFLPSVDLPLAPANGDEVDAFLSRFQFWFFNYLTQQAGRPSSNLHNRFIVLSHWVIAEEVRESRAASERTLESFQYQLDEILKAVQSHDNQPAEHRESLHTSELHSQSSPTSERRLKDTRVSLVEPRLGLKGAPSNIGFRLNRIVAAFNYFVVLGAPGSGKSTLCYQLMSATRDRTVGLEPLHGMVPCLLHLGQEFSNDLTGVGRLNPIEEWLPEEVRAASSQGRLLLLLDGVDEVPPANKDETHRMIHNLVESLPPGNRLVVTSRQLEIGIGGDLLVETAILPLTSTDIRELLGRLGDAGQVNKSEIDRIWEMWSSLVSSAPEQQTPFTMQIFFEWSIRYGPGPMNLGDFVAMTINEVIRRLGGGPGMSGAVRAALLEIADANFNGEVVPRSRAIRILALRFIDAEMPTALVYEESARIMAALIDTGLLAYATPDDLVVVHRAIGEVLRG